MEEGSGRNWEGEKIFFLLKYEKYFLWDSILFKTFLPNFFLHHWLDCIFYFFHRRGGAIFKVDPITWYLAETPHMGSWNLVTNQNNLYLHGFIDVGSWAPYSTRRSTCNVPYRWLFQGFWHFFPTDYNSVNLLSVSEQIKDGKQRCLMGCSLSNIFSCVEESMQ